MKFTVRQAINYRKHIMRVYFPLLLIAPQAAIREKETESPHAYDGAFIWDARRDERAAVFASPELAAEITRRNHKRTEYSVRP